MSVSLLSSAEDLLQFASNAATLNLSTLQQLLQQLAKASRNPAAAAAIQQDPRLQQLLQQIGLLLQQADARQLSNISHFLALLRVSNLHTQQVELFIRLFVCLSCCCCF